MSSDATGHITPDAIQSTRCPICRVAAGAACITLPGDIVEWKTHVERIDEHRDNERRRGWDVVAKSKNMEADFAKEFETYVTASLIDDLMNMVLDDRGVPATEWSNGFRDPESGMRREARMRALRAEINKRIPRSAEAEEKAGSR